MLVGFCFYFWAAMVTETVVVTETTVAFVVLWSDGWFGWWFDFRSVSHIIVSLSLSISRSVFFCLTQWFTWSMRNDGQIRLRLQWFVAAIFMTLCHNITQHTSPDTILNAKNREHYAQPINPSPILMNQFGFFLPVRIRCCFFFFLSSSVPFNATKTGINRDLHTDSVFRLQAYSWWMMEPAHGFITTFCEYIQNELLARRTM